MNNPVTSYSSVPAPSPFIGLRSEMERPITRKEKQLVARWLYKKNGTLRYIIQQKATYPLTDIEIELVDQPSSVPAAEKNRMKKQLLSDYMKKLKIIPAIKQLGIDFHTFSIAFMYLWLKTDIYVTCPHCKKKMKLRTLDESTWSVKYDKDKDTLFEVKCAKCSHTGATKAEEKISYKIDKMRLAHFDPVRVEMKEHSISGDRQFWYSPSPKDVRRITSGDKTYILDSSLDFIKACMSDGSLKLNNDNLFVIKMMDPSQSGMPWPEPAALKPFNQIYNNLLLEKASEAIAIQHTVPLPIFFPRLAGDEDLSKGSIMLQKFRDELFGQLKQWVKNPNHFVISNIPLGVEQALGRGNMLFPTAQIQYNTEEAMLAMGSPRGLFNGSAHYAGSTAAMRIVENSWIETYNAYNEAIDFISNMIMSYLPGWPKHTAKFKEFRRMDDVMYKNQIAAGFQRGAVSHDEYCSTLGLDPIVQREKIKEYQLWQANLSVEIQDIQMQAQVKSQSEMQNQIAAFAASQMDDSIRTNETKTISLFESYMNAGIPKDIAASIIKSHYEIVNQQMAMMAASMQAQQAQDTIMMREQANAQTSLNRGQKDRFLFTQAEQGGMGQTSLMGEDRVSFISGMLSSMPEEQRLPVLENLRKYDQETYQAVVSTMRMNGAATEQKQEAPQDDGTKPLPDKMPPKREGMGY